MKDRIDQWQERFEAFSLRERGLISAAIVVVMFMLWDTMVLTPQEVKQKNVVSQMYSLNEKMEAISKEVESMTDKLRSGEGQRVRARTEEIRNLLAGLERKQQDLTVEFIRPAQMAKVLEDMLSNESSLKLTRLESLGAEPLFPPPELKEGEKAPRVKQPNIFKHGMRVVFEGNFNSTVSYLKALESMPWRFYWDNVEYQVLEYPRAQVVITIHTLSLDEGWIGV